VTPGNDNNIDETDRVFTRRWDLGFFRGRAILAFAALAALLAMNVVKAENARTRGAEVTLKTRPVDPRDLFFGHYATLPYDLDGRDLGAFMTPALRAEIDNRPPRDLLLDAIVSTRENKLYIILEKQGRFHEPILVTRQASSVPPGAIALEASGTPYRQRNCTEENCPVELRVSLDLPQRYYADKQTALSIEAEARDITALQRRITVFERCESQRTRGADDPDFKETATCANQIVRPVGDPDQAFGVILSVTSPEKAVIRGLLIDDQRIIDTLSGPRLQLTRS